MSVRDKKWKQKRRHLRIRKKIKGSAERPRMVISKSNKNMFVQFIDDEKSVTLAAVSTVKESGNANVESSIALGKKAAEAASKAGIKNVVVDRAGFKFHGKLKAVVESMRESGITTGA